MHSSLSFFVSGQAQQIFFFGFVSASGPIVAKPVLAGDSGAVCFGDTATAALPILAEVPIEICAQKFGRLQLDVSRQYSMHA